jgi:uncharacterized RDD family membrane protein YckC
MTIDEYVKAVVSQLPARLVDRERVEADLRAHVADRVAGGMTQEEAVSHLGRPEEVAAELLTTVHLEPSGRTRRLAAFLIDCLAGAIPVSLLLVFVMLPLIFGDDLGFAIGLPAAGFAWPVGIFILFGISVPIMALLYYPVLEKLYGQTVGKWAMGIVVVRENGATLRWRDAIIRRIPFVFEFFWLDALFALFTAKRQRAFDFVASTLVVRVERSSQRVPTPVPVM